MLYTTLIAPLPSSSSCGARSIGALALALGAGPVGVILMLRRMSLMGDAMAHAILPGAAIGFLVSGLNLFAMTLGGLVAGFVIALAAGLVARSTELKEDASLAAFFLISLAVGVTIVSVRGTNIDLLHFLFGTVLALDNQALILIAGNTTITLFVLALIYRPLVLECVDPGFLRSVSGAGAAFTSRLPGARGDQSRQRLPCARHAACGRHHDGAGGDRTVLGARHHRHDRDRGRERVGRELCGPAALVPRQRAVGSRHHPGGGRALCRVGAVRTGRGPAQAALSRERTWKREFLRKPL